MRPATASGVPGSAHRWLAQATGKLLVRVRQEGLAGAARAIRANVAHCRWHWRDSGFDRRHGVSTSGYILPQHLDVPRGQTHFSSEYEPSSERTLSFILENLSVEVEGFTFIDLGSGKGRALLIASDYPFKQVIGVEFSRALHEIAQENIRRYRNPARRCFATCSICMEAERFAFPDGPCVVYLFDPFAKEIMQRVVANLERSHLAQPRPIVVVYYAPVHRELFDSAAFLQETEAMSLPRDRNLLRQYKVAVYKTMN